MSPLERLIANPLIRRVVKNSAYLFSASGIIVVVGFFQNLLVTNLIGVTLFGVLGVTIKFTSVINKLASFRMNELVVKYVGQFIEEGDSQRAAAVFKLASLIEIFNSFVSYSIIFLLSPLAARFLAKDVNTTQLFTLYGLIVLSNLIFESATGLLQILDCFRKIATLQIVQSLVTLVLIAISFFTESGIIGIILAYMAGKVINGLGVAIIALVEATTQWGHGWWRAPFHLLKGQFRDLARFAINTNISATINLFNKDSEELWISFFRGPTETGYYKQAIALSNLVHLPVSPLPKATYPELSREVVRKNWTNIRYILKQGSRLAAGYTGLAAIGLILFGQPLISLLYKPDYLPAYPALVILLAGLFIANTFYWNRIALLSFNRPDYPTKVNAIAALLKIGLALILIPRFGYLASAALLAGYYFLSIGFNVRKTYKELGEREKIDNVKRDP